MGDLIVAASALFALAVVLWTLARRGDPGRRQPPSQEPEIISIRPLDGAPGMYHYEYNPRRLPRGRRNPAPPGAVIHHRSATPADNRGKADTANREG